MKIMPQSIIVEGNRRKADPIKVNELAESIKEIGLINPITVRRDDEFGKFILIAGLHRLEAHKKLGKGTIEVNVISGDSLMYELIEIDENLMRNELHQAEIDDLTARRKEIYEEMYPDTKVGGDRGNQYTGGKSRNPSLAKPSFVEDTANKTGKSETTIKESLYRSNNLIPEAKAIFKADTINKTEATKLAREEPETQAKVIDLISKGQAKKVEEAKKQLDPIDIEYDKRAKEIEAKGKRIKKVMNLLNYTQHLGITEQHLREYFSDFPNNYNSFVNDLEKLKTLIDDVLSIYSEITMIRRIK